jgi:hypothetical protein
MSATTDHSRWLRSPQPQAGQGGALTPVQQEALGPAVSCPPCPAQQHPLGTPPGEHFWGRTKAFISSSRTLFLGMTAAEERQFF